MFDEQAHSGLSAKAFCKARKLCPKYFSLRRKQFALRDEGDTPSITRTQPNAFVQVKRRGVEHASHYSHDRDDSSESVVLDGSFGRLTLPKTVSPDWMASLLRALA